MPEAFRDTMFTHARRIIDCTEVFIQRPTSLSAQSQTSPSYEHHNTIKGLVVIAPSEAITFLSQAWGGRVSDKEPMQKCGILNIVEQDDVFLVDRGFRCEEMFAVKGAKIVMPSLTKLQPQLSGEVTQSRELSRVQIHVERAIERLKTFRILQSATCQLHQDE
uniref:DDE Tnp4 domain-containing protein n=1 Tax=Ixodes scapularis TaxID=6945 RepID=A0A1S4M6H5_IXOSC